MMCKHLNYIQMRAIGNCFGPHQAACYPCEQLIATFYRVTNCITNPSRQINGEDKSVPIYLVAYQLMNQFRIDFNFLTLCRVRKLHM